MQTGEIVGTGNDGKLAGLEPKKFVGKQFERKRVDLVCLADVKKKRKKERRKLSITYSYIFVLNKNHKRNN